MKVAIVGAGVLGRLLALELASRSFSVTLIDERNGTFNGSASWSAAGMLAPFCELETSSSLISRLGSESIPLWETLLDQFTCPVFFQWSGSLVIATAPDRGELNRLLDRVNAVDPSAASILASDKINHIEPELSHRFFEGIYFLNEAQIDPREFLSASRRELDRSDVKVRWSTKVRAISPHKVSLETGDCKVDWVVDCRGLGAQSDLPALRAVRGELIHVDAPEVNLTRPIRLMHPRYPLYIVPRRPPRYLIGATLIESNDQGTIRVQSMLELLSAAFAVHSGFAEARVVETVAACRPAFPDHEPHVYLSPGLARVNGLYRHGFLISPRLSQLVADSIESGKIPDSEKLLFEEAA